MGCSRGMKFMGKYKPYAVRALVASLAVLLFSGIGRAQAPGEEERILDFQSLIEVREDGLLQVTEIITVRSLGVSIKRGIYRDFPTTYSEKFGFTKRVDFNVTGVLRDNMPEPYHTEDQGNGTRLYIGSSSVFLDPGVYTYTITYTTNRQLAFKEDFVELYWNVTGNGWSFPIDHALAEVTLPAGAMGRILSKEGWTGPAGSTEKNYSSRIDARGTVHFETTRPLAAQEGMTLSVRWQRGFVAEPDRQELLSFYVRDNRDVVAGLCGLLLVLLYYFTVWVIAGRDPSRGTIIPLYDSPDRLSPAALRFITEMGYDHRAFAAAVIDMAVRGHLTISDDGGEYTLTRADTAVQGLPPEEKKISEKLFSQGPSITLESKNHSRISSAIKSFKGSLSLQYEKHYFVKNLGLFVPGLVLSVLILVVSFAMAIGTAPEVFILIWLTFWSMGVSVLLIKVVSAWREVLAKQRYRIITAAGALFITLFSIPFVGAEIFVFVYYLTVGSPWTLVILLGVIALNILFYFLLKAPTRAGRKLLDRIEGFKMFLAVAERDRLNAVHRPSLDVSTFERFLPYALALNVENQWAEYFSGILASAEHGGSYSPRWYSGGSWAGLGAAGFASSLGSSFSSAISSSSTAPGSGSGGGGSSGGGGGGGGGGGW